MAVTLSSRALQHPTVITSDISGNLATRPTYPSGSRSVAASGDAKGLYVGKRAAGPRAVEESLLRTSRGQMRKQQTGQSTLALMTVKTLSRPKYGVSIQPQANHTQRVYNPTADNVSWPERHESRVCSNRFPTVFPTRLSVGAELAKKAI